MSKQKLLQTVFILFGVLLGMGLGIGIGKRIADKWYAQQGSWQSGPTRAITCISESPEIIRPNWEDSYCVDLINKEAAKLKTEHNTR